jgi:hypothetical protein
MKHERRTDSCSHPRGGVADFNLGTQQNMELGMTFHLTLKSTMVVANARLVSYSGYTASLRRSKGKSEPAAAQKAVVFSYCL